MMKMTKIASLIAAAVTLTACGAANTVSLNKVSETPRQVYSAATPAVTGEASTTEFGFFPKETQDTNKTYVQLASVDSEFDVVDVQVVVPDYLVVSEADVYLPQADIVWREDPLGDRRAQVKTIVEHALRAGTAPLNGKQKVILAARVNTFHALTEKTRNTVGGKHNIKFDFVLIDAETRQPVTTVQKIDASLKGFGGRRAYDAVRRGETQKKRITDHVANTVLKVLSEPKRG